MKWICDEIVDNLREIQTNIFKFLRWNLKTNVNEKWLVFWKYVESIKWILRDFFFFSIQEICEWNLRKKLKKIWENCVDVLNKFGKICYKFEERLTEESHKREILWKISEIFKK